MENICLGGTFSPLHAGHMALLVEAFRRGRRVSIGLTSDEMASRGRERRVKPFEERKKTLVEALERLSSKYSVPYTVEEITDRVGFAVMSEIDSIVVSTETERNVDIIDEERRRVGLPPLKRVVVNIVTDRKGTRLSSTRVASGQIDPEGNVLGSPLRTAMKGGGPKNG
ncbi:MAG: pantetheine-phosphate adenylyltransferase [Candidatus Thermoplasmatota archaeon]|nr:pantetheine-phosphate adenylyltransferase [Candidatus Thermoplasmatota archaeon]